MTARKQTKPVPSTYAWPCTILSIDPGKAMGLAILRDGVPIFVDTEFRRSYIAALVRASSIPTIAIIEHHTPHGRLGMKGYRTMVKDSGKAARDCEYAGIPEAQVLYVEPNVWQGALGFGGSLRSAERKRGAKQRALSYKGVADDISFDVADAICIGVWGSFAAEVGAVLGAIKLVDMKVALQATVDEHQALVAEHQATVDARRA